jgi:hypothetical protein
MSCMGSRGLATPQLVLPSTPPLHAARGVPPRAACLSLELALCGLPLPSTLLGLSLCPPPDRSLEIALSGLPLPSRAA